MTSPLRRSIALRTSHAIDRLDEADAVLVDLAELGLTAASVAGVSPAVEVQRLIELAAAAQYKAAAVAVAAGIAPVSHTDLALTPNHARLFYLLGLGRAHTDEQLFRLWQPRTVRKENPWPFISEAGLRSRRAELVRWGLVGEWDQTGVTKAGRPATRWTYTGERPAGALRVPPPSAEGRAVLEALFHEPDVNLVTRSHLARLVTEATA